MTASFREPGTHLYHITLPLPPISTIIGLAGAALGKDFKGAWTFFKTNAVAVGVKGKACGSGIDLWRYKKIAQAKSEDEKKALKEFGRDKSVRDDILNREFLAYPEVHICYTAPESKVIEELRHAFCSPYYALSLGSSDDIVKVQCISKVCEPDEKNDVTSLNCTLVEGELLGNVTFDWEAIKKTGVKETLRSPMVKQLIVDFEFDGDERHGIRYCPFTFLAGKHRLDKPVTVFAIEGQDFPMFSIAEK
jgi:CRISPR-associated protein Cas5t